VLISVVGAGYVGLVTAACLARLGNEVRCVDRDARLVAHLRRGELHIHEPGLAELVQAGTADGRLTFDTDQAAAHGTSFVILAVGTLDEDGNWTSDLARALSTRGAQLALYDPTGAARAQAMLESEGISAATAASAVAACRDADAVVVATEWPEFHELDWTDLARAMSGRVVFDTRNVIDAPAARAAGFDAFVLRAR